MPEPLAMTIMVIPEIFDRVKAAIERELPNVNVSPFAEQLWESPDTPEYYVAPKEIGN